jgi:membrane protein DedA with SNARE-associated domain
LPVISSTTGSDAARAPRRAFQPPACSKRRGAWLTGRGIWIAFVSRFVYGLRVAIPVACGITRMPPLRFSIIDGAGAFLWAAIVGAFGAVIGHVLELLIEGHPSL